MAYTPPAYNDINFVVTGSYTAPAHDNINFVKGGSSGSGGVGLQDMQTDIVLASQVFEDTALDLLTAYQILEDMPLDFNVLSEIIQDSHVDVLAVYQILADIALISTLAIEDLNQNTMLDIVISDGIILQNTTLDLAVTNGIKLHDAGIDLAVIEVMPSFKAVYAIHLKSAVKAV